MAQGGGSGSSFGRVFHVVLIAFQGPEQYGLEVLSVDENRAEERRSGSENAGARDGHLYELAL